LKFKGVKKLSGSAWYLHILNHNRPSQHIEDKQNHKTVKGGAGVKKVLLLCTLSLILGNSGVASATDSPSLVPEPVTMIFLGSGLIRFAVFGRKNSLNSAPNEN